MHLQATKLQDEMKRQLGLELGKLRRRICLGVLTMPGFNEQQIRLAELGHTRCWRLYQDLLDFYHMDIEIRLKDREDESAYARNKCLFEMRRNRDKIAVQEKSGKIISEKRMPFRRQDMR